MDTLCEDVIYEIFKYLDSSSIASFSSINQFCLSIGKNHPEIKNRQILSKQLNKTIIKNRKYYSSEVLDLKVGDRITDRIKNYRVHVIKKRTGILEVIDLYGNSLGEYVPVKIYNMKKSKLKEDNSFWSTIFYDEFQNLTIVNKLMPGMIKHEYGPMIKHLDSYYLKYYTEPQYIFYNNDTVGKPIKNMLVTIYYKWNVYEYYVKYIDNNRLILKIIEKKDLLNEELIMDKLNGKWIMQDKKYSIIFFGGWNNRL